MASCSLIADELRLALAAALEAARLQGVRIERFSFSDGAPYADLNPNTSLIAISFDRLRHLPPAGQAHLRARVAGGATLYVNGGIDAGQPSRLAPFAPGELVPFRIAGAAYRMTDHPALPAALRKEERSANFESLAASCLPAAGEPLLLTRGDGGERVSIFLLTIENGAVIYDLTSDRPACAMPLLAMLENPATLPTIVGGLAAANLAWKSASAASPYNLVIDDRPIDFDYFNGARLLTFLRHVMHLCPGAHVDFAWTPAHTHPSRRYVEALKAFPTGFVWHGLRRHVDHRAIADLDAEFAAGRRLVEALSAAHRVRFQPVMVFPFERDTPRCVEFLKRAGFIAKAQECDVPPAVASEENFGRSTGRATPAAPPFRFVVLERLPVERLWREAMVARAALGLPIIAAAHPCDLGLGRLARLSPLNRGTLSHFDPVLRFAAEKNLTAASLEEIAFSAIRSN